MKLRTKHVMTTLIASALLSASTFAEICTFAIDKSHSTIEFGIKHMALSTVKGVFTDYDGSVTWDSADQKSVISGTVKVKSIDTRDAKRDAHLRDKDFFSADQFPEMTFVSKSIKKVKNRYVMIADLTIKGITKSITVPLEVSPVLKDPWGNSRASFSTSFVINRQDFGLKYSQLLDNGGLMIGNDVTVSLDIEAIQK
jgi:polyisoprenoid-binding protein YceI